MDSGHWYAGTLQCRVLTTHASFSRPQLDALGIVIAAEKLSAKLRNEVVAETVRMFAMPQRAMAPSLVVPSLLLPLPVGLATVRRALCRAGRRPLREGWS